MPTTHRVVYTKTAVAELTLVRTDTLGGVLHGDGIVRNLSEDAGEHQHDHNPLPLV